MAGASTAAAPYGASPIFDENSLPDKLRNEHSTKDGTWGLLRILEGEVELAFFDPPSQRLVTVDTPAPNPAPGAALCPTNPAPIKMQGGIFPGTPR